MRDGEQLGERREGARRYDADMADFHGLHAAVKNLRIFDREMLDYALKPLGT